MGQDRAGGGEDGEQAVHGQERTGELEMYNCSISDSVSFQYFDNKRFNNRRAPAHLDPSVNDFSNKGAGGEQRGVSLGLDN